MRTDFSVGGMDTGSDELNSTQWAAAISLFVVLMVPLAVVLAWWCKQRYARAVVALQRQSAAAAPIVEEAPSGAAPAPLTIDVVTVVNERADLPAALAAAYRVRRRVLLSQALLGGVLWVLLLTTVAVALLVWSRATGQPDDASAASGLWTHLVLWPLLLAPPWLAWALQAGWRESHVWIAFGVGFAAIFIGSAGSGTGLLSSAVLVGLMAAMSALPLAFMRPAFRGAGPPLVLALSAGIAVFWILGAIGAALDDSDADAPLTLADGWQFAWLALMFAVAGWCAWRLLLRLARRYGEKRFSDVALAHSAYWSLIAAFAASAALMLSYEERTGGAMQWVALSVFILWWLWRSVQRRVVAALARSAPSRGPALLLLRVFKPSARSESFMDRLLARWRFAGPAWLIAGPDLAGAFMEPDEFFVWLRRRLRERFIACADEVPSRVDALDNARDPDGRFRVSELFCADSTWKPAVLSLMDRADVVLLDLREFTPARAGTHYELVQLLRRADLRKVRVLVGTGDAMAPLQAALQSAWREAQRAPENASPAQARLQVLHLDERSDAQVRALATALAQAAQR